MDNFFFLGGREGGVEQKLRNVKFLCHILSALRKRRETEIASRSWASPSQRAAHTVCRCCVSTARGSEDPFLIQSVIAGVTFLALVLSLPGISILAPPPCLIFTDASRLLWG